MESSGFDLGVYSTNRVKQVIVSCALFVLFFIAQTIDFNSVLTDFGVNQSAISRGKLIFVYMFSYFLFIIKFFLAFLFFIILIIAIVIIFTSFFSVLKIDMKEEFKNANAPEYNDKLIEVAEKNASPLFTKIMQNSLWMGRYLASFLSMNQFMLIYLVVIPFDLFFIYLFYSLIIYHPERIEKDKNNMQTDMNTNHMYLFYIFVSFSIMAFIYICFNYAMAVSSGLP